ncbi:MAG TPA: SIS domain-containing protein [Chloroflexota bacterium]|nr:SIS domain-containing protein [Chloroflexota bacterium]
MTAIQSYFDAAAEIVRKVTQTQFDAIEQAAQRCAAAIAADHVVHLFGSGHSRMAVEEIWPRYGSFPGFHPIVELSLTFHNQVVGANGQRQAMFVENTPGFARAILRNFALHPEDVMVVFSTSGTSVVPVEIASHAREAGLFTIGVMSVDHCRRAEPKQQDGHKLLDVVDLTLDNCAPPGDATVHVLGLTEPVGPTSTLGNTVIANALKCRVAELLAAAGKPPLVLTSSLVVGPEESARLFDAAYDDYARRTRNVLRVP